MKIALILAANKWAAPYLKIYIDLLNKHNVSYDIIYWNRDLTENNSHLSWNQKPKNGNINRFLDYKYFSNFVKRILKSTEYDRLIIFGEVLPIFLSSFLRNKYDNRFLIDFRDLGIEQLPIFRQLYAATIRKSALNIVSSSGFIKYLPKSTYFISHNFDIKQIKDSLNSNYTSKNNHKDINILTIGSIRNYESNLAIIRALENRANIHLQFVGKGIVSSQLEKYTIKNNIRNVTFKGYYKKTEELNIIEKCDFMNIFMPNIKSHSSLMSNRFYNALLLRKPMIVTSNSEQAKLVKNYNLGISIENCDNLEYKLKSFLENLDEEVFANNCKNLLKKFIDDYNLFEDKVSQFILK